MFSKFFFSLKQKRNKVQVRERCGIESFFFKIGENKISLYYTVREGNIADAGEKGEKEK